MKGFALVLLIAGLVLIGCEKSTDPAATKGALTFSAYYTPEATTLGKAAGTSAVDSVVLSRVRIVLRDIKYKSVEDSLNFKSDPIVLELDLQGAMQSVVRSDVPFGTYRRVEFDVHRVEQSELTGMSAAEQSKFADFLAGERYSVIVEGTFYQSGQAGAAFTFRSKIDAKQKYDLDPVLVVDERTTDVATTMVVSSAGWFKNTLGALLDPTVTENEPIISENIKTSIKIFKDNNRDGMKDPN